MIEYRDLPRLLIESLPELGKPYSTLIKSWGEGSPGPHVVFGDVLNPYLISLLESSSERDRLNCAFEFLERLAREEDKLIQEVVALTVIERLADREEWMVSAWPYMGPRLRAFAKEVAEYWGSSPGFPFS